MDMAVPSTSQQRQQPQQQEREDTLSDEGDSMDDDDDDDLQPSGLNSSGSSSPTNQQVLFLNFTSDLSPQTTPSRKKSSTQTKKAAYRVNGVNILNRYVTKKVNGWITRFYFDRSYDDYCICKLVYSLFLTAITRPWMIYTPIIEKTWTAKQPSNVSNGGGKTTTT
jgi:hypothetical protein